MSTDHSRKPHHPSDSHDQAKHESTGASHGAKSAPGAVTSVPRASITNVILLVAVGVLLFGMGYKIGQGSAAPSGGQVMTFGGDAPAVKSREDINFQLFWKVWDVIDEKYIDDKKIDAQKMYYGAIKGMVATLEDPYTFFLTPDENKKSKDDLGGRFEGIGAQLGLKNGQIIVEAPLKNSPAMQAGLKAGDIIIKVDGADATDWSLSEAVSKIRGEGGTQVTLTVYRAGEGQKEFKITRDTIKVDSVELTYERGNSVAVVKINQFGETTNAEWDTAINDITNKYRAGQVKSMIIDVRDNPGGYLDSSVYIASEFLGKGKLVVKQESTVEQDREYFVRRDGKLLDIPVVVLINGGSASASEILSGALRDHDRATLVGEKSFGKGSVQEALDLDGGAGVHVTVAKWILPDGDWINGKGIEPAIKVSLEAKEGNTLTRETDTQLNRAVEEAEKAGR
jgi:carboxyl-terminal processing protease